MYTSLRIDKMPEILYKCPTKEHFVGSLVML